MLHRFVMNNMQANIAICGGTIIAVAAVMSIYGVGSLFPYLCLVAGLWILFTKWFMRMSREDEEEFLRQRKRDREQQSRYAAELQHMPEAQRIVVVHQAMEAWKALGRP